MPVRELGACEWFVQDLHRSSLLEGAQLSQVDQLISEFLRQHPRAEPPLLAEFLVKQGALTSFQVDHLLKGKTQGLVLGQYVLMGPLGTGSMGAAYKTLSKLDHQWYAVKVLPRRSMWNVRIARRIVKLFENCRHPAVVPFADVGTSGSTHYLAWPFVEGETLENMVQRAGKLTPQQTATYGAKTAEGLEICHQQGLIHGLLKPSNLLIVHGDEVRILDLGVGSLLMQAEEQSLVDTMSSANTLTSGLDCASPESILEPTNRTAAGDQYSLGCVLYFCLAGRYPFEGSAVDKMMAHQMKPPTSLKDLNPDVPDDLSAIIHQLLQKKPEGRFSSMNQVAEVLQAAARRIFVPDAGRSVSRAAALNVPDRASLLVAKSQETPKGPVQEPQSEPAHPTLPVSPLATEVERKGADSVKTPAPVTIGSPLPLDQSTSPLPFIGGALLIGLLAWYFLVQFWQ